MWKVVTVDARDPESGGQLGHLAGRSALSLVVEQSRALLAVAGKRHRREARRKTRLISHALALWQGRAALTQNRVRRLSTTSRPSSVWATLVC